MRDDCLEQVLCYVVDGLQVNRTQLNTRGNVVSEDIWQLRLHSGKKVAKLNASLEVQFNFNNIVLDNGMLLIELTRLRGVPLFPRVLRPKSRTILHV